MDLKETLQAHRAELEAQVAEHERALQPLYAERDAIVAEMQALELKLREVHGRIKPAEAPLKAARQELAEVARVLGARSVRNG